MACTEDVAVQTTISHLAPPMPIPLQYPVNLIYAQSMLSMCLSQQQCVDLNIAQLRFYLRQHERSALANTQALKTTSPGRSPCIGCMSAACSYSKSSVCPVAQAVEGRGTTTPVDEANVAAGTPPAAAAPAQPEPAELRRMQRRLSTALKLALVMVLLEVRASWFLLYFIGVLLYIGGLFDPLIEVFQRQSAQNTLDQQLTALRNRQAQATDGTENRNQNQSSMSRQSAPPASDQNQDRMSIQAVTPTTDGEAERPPNDEHGSMMKETLDRETTTANSSELHDAKTSSAEQPSTAAAEPAENEKCDGGEEAAGGFEAAPASENAGTNQAPNEAQPRWAHRFIYQLFVMFFMTLMPWWSPDPRYM